ncbi:LysR family transcriptional regulator [Terrihabitans rhizophilus]|uniref:LysR family transcriptional regulator n=1 Tax=Terrihabitans rhizophilus TaxID=3092662 RepID=A0ABU4RJ43_9HYPH|nr:LysR family transcriptional regulator [Terrihabitans sp. PJ23]MDX6804862.1 LysR family transcriptional regulator [Terrihabitans sp. PJ23]
MRRLDNIDLRLLRIFVALADAGGFNDAQIQLNLSQSALSTHLAALERKLGGTLCERGRRGFRLTEFGQATYTAARQLFADIEAFDARLGRGKERLTGRLRIAIVDGVVSSPDLSLHGALGRYRRQAPDVFLDLTLATPQDLERLVSDGARDIGIGPMSQKAPGLTYVPFVREPHTLYCGSGHPLFSQRDEEIDRDAVEQAAFSVRGYLHFDDIYRANHPRPSATVMHMEAQVMMILSGTLIGFLPRHIGDEWAQRGLMRAVRPDIYSFTSQHFITYRTSDSARPVVQELVQHLRKPGETSPAS